MSDPTVTTRRATAPFARRPAPGRSPGRARRHAGGQALAEFLLIVPVSMIALGGLCALGSYGLARQQATAAARLMAWQRTAWLPKAVTDQGGVSGALKKEDAELRRDLVRHALRDRSRPAMDLHRAAMGEFAERPADGADPRQQLAVATRQAAPPSTLKAVDRVFSRLRDTQNVLKQSYASRPMGSFQFLSGGYLRNEVSLTQSVDTLPLAPRLTMSAQVTLLTEAWNAGGTSRENARIAGLVPLKLLDAPFYQQVRSGPHQASNAIRQVVPSFDATQIEFGWKPGATDEVTPPDRLEQRRDKAGKLMDGKYRYYLSFPPAPPRESMP